MADINARKRGKKWEYYFEIAKMDGKRKRISKGGFNTKAEAVSEGVKAMHEYQTAGTVNTPSELSMHDYLNYWIEMYCIPNLKPTTVANYKKYIRLLISPKIGKYRLATITAEQLQKLINDMVANGYSKNTVIGIKGVLSSSLNYAVQPLHYLKTSPMAYVKIPKGSRTNYRSSQYKREVIEKDTLGDLPVPSVDFLHIGRLVQIQTKTEIAVDLLDGFDRFQPEKLLHQLDNIAVSLTAVTVIVIFIQLAGRVTLPVEWAERHVCSVYLYTVTASCRRHIDKLFYIVENSHFVTS